MPWFCAFSRRPWTTGSGNDVADRNAMARRKREQAAAPWWRGVRLRRVLRAMAAGGALVVTLGAMAAGVSRALQPETLPVRAVLIEGEFRHLDRRELEDVLAPHVTGGFFSVDLNAVEHAGTTLPWVYGIAVRRNWPDTLVVRVTEQVPVARWSDTQLVNRFGDVFTPSPESLPEGLPALEGGPGRQRTLMRRYLAVQARLADVGIQVEGIREDARQAWRIDLTGGARILMGRDTGADHLERLLRVYPRVAAHRDAPIRTMDLRYTNGIAVAWDEDARAGQ
jgi:cell division protein FtsQ